MHKLGLQLQIFAGEQMPFGEWKAFFASGSVILLHLFSFCTKAVQESLIKDAPSPMSRLVEKGV